MADQSPRNADLEHSGAVPEGSDFSARGVILFAIGLAVVTAILMAILGVMFKSWAAKEKRLELPLSPTISQQVRLPPAPLEPHEKGSLPLSPDQLAKRQPLPPGPRLEGLMPSGQRPTIDERKREAKEYGWVDRQKGVVRIPVEEAMQVLAGKLPSRPTGPEEAGRPGSAPTGSNSGRTLPQDGAAASPEP
jgi:hypothetical protein